jgi:hypothetical protein
MLFSAAITVVFTRGTLFEALRGGPHRAREAEARIVRFFRDLVSCPLCCGVWIGAAVSLVHDSGGAWGAARAADLLGFSCVCAVLALIAYSAIDWLQAPHWEGPSAAPTYAPAPPAAAAPQVPPKPPEITGG